MATENNTEELLELLAGGKAEGYYANSLRQLKSASGDGVETTDHEEIDAVELEAQANVDASA